MPRGALLKLPLHGHATIPPDDHGRQGNMAIGGFGRSMVTGGFG